MRPGVRWDLYRFIAIRINTTRGINRTLFPPRAPGTMMVQALSSKYDMSMEIRKATPDDSELVAKVLVESWRHAYKGIIPINILDNLSVEKKSVVWSNHLSTGGEAYVLIESKSIIGVIEISRFREKIIRFKQYAEISVI